MIERLQNCPICNNTSLDLFLEIKDHSITNEKFTLSHCKSCDFIFTNPRPDENSLSHYYESPDYISHSNSNTGLVNKIYQIVRAYSSRKKLALITKLANNDKTILDFGCGTGTFLNECKKNRWDAKGIEPNKNAREVALNHYGLSIDDENGLRNISPKSFQIITLWHVLEHVHDLRRKIENIAWLLKDQGKILIALPNYKSFDASHYHDFWAGFDVPRHLYHFTGKSIRDLLEQIGFKCVETIPMKFDSYYVSMLSEKYKGNKLPMLKGAFYGLKSNLIARINPEKYSSVIYVFGKV